MNYQPVLNQANLVENLCFDSWGGSNDQAEGPALFYTKQLKLIINVP